MILSVCCLWFLCIVLYLLLLSEHLFQQHIHVFRWTNRLTKWMIKSWFINDCSIVLNKRILFVASFCGSYGPLTFSKTLSEVNCGVTKTSKLTKNVCYFFQFGLNLSPTVSHDMIYRDLCVAIWYISMCYKIELN